MRVELTKVDGEYRLEAKVGRSRLKDDFHRAVEPLKWFVGLGNRQEPLVCGAIGLGQGRRVDTIYGRIYRLGERILFLRRAGLLFSGGIALKGAHGQRILFGGRIIEAKRALQILHEIAIKNRDVLALPCTRNRRKCDGKGPKVHGCLTHRILRSNFLRVSQQGYRGRLMTESILSDRYLRCDRKGYRAYIFDVAQKPK